MTSGPRKVQKGAGRLKLCVGLIFLNSLLDSRVFAIFATCEAELRLAAGATVVCPFCCTLLSHASRELTCVN